MFRSLSKYSKNKKKLDKNARILEKLEKVKRRQHRKVSKVTKGLIQEVKQKNGVMLINGLYFNEMLDDLSCKLGLSKQDTTIVFDYFKPEYESIIKNGKSIKIKCLGNDKIFLYTEKRKFEDGEINFLYFLSDKEIYTNPNCDEMFARGSNSSEFLFIVKEIIFNNFNTSMVTSMNGMFRHNGFLTGLELSNFDTSNVTNMKSMFEYCYSLNVLDLSNFNTNNVINMECMFSGCENLRIIDISSFDTSKVTEMCGMFDHCEYLHTIYASSSFVTTNIKKSISMFYDCHNLQGANGTIVTSKNEDKLYARIDTVDTPGYFTLKTN